MSLAPHLRQEAETLAAHLPPLMAGAERLAHTVHMGEHGRRRAGLGDSFWQYRPFQPEDGARRIDWRRSARSDETFVQEKEWQVAQSVTLWVDGGASMSYGSGDLPKADRARTLVLAIAILLARAGEKVGYLGALRPRRGGGSLLEELATLMLMADPLDHAPLGESEMPGWSRALFVSDFLGDPAQIEAAVAQSAAKGVRGVLLQVLDPAEAEFPFSGRRIFESMSGNVSHETLRAGNLKDRYLARLAERQDTMAALARRTGWQFMTHRTDRPATEALHVIWSALERPF